MDRFPISLSLTCYDLIGLKLGGIYSAWARATRELQRGAPLPGTLGRWKQQSLHSVQASLAAPLESGSSYAQGTRASSSDHSPHPNTEEKQESAQLGKTARVLEAGTFAHLSYTSSSPRTALANGSCLKC